MASSDFGLRTINHSEFEGWEELCDIVVVHGLYGSSHNSWTDIKWEVELDSFHDGPAYPRLSLYTYDIFGSNGGILTSRGATDEATRLLNSLLELRQNGPANAPITFIVHDLGGSLVKETVVLAQQRKYKEIYTSIASMIFLGCPHQGLKADLQTGCANLLMSHMKTTYSEAWDLSGPLVEWAQATNEFFAETRISAVATIYTCVSSHPDRKERVFDKDITSMLAKADVFTTDLGHKDLLKHLILSSKRQELFWMKRYSNAVIRRHINNFVSQAPPQYLIDATSFSKEQPELSAARGAYLDFISAAGASCLLVHALGSPGCNAVETAEQMLKWTDDLTQQVLPVRSCAFFNFDANDCQSDSAEAALSNILAELCSQCRSPEETKATQETLQSLDKCQNIQVEDLYTTYVNLVLAKLSLWRQGFTVPPEATFTLILGNLDGGIRNGCWLFQKLEDVIHDCDLRLKILITSSNPASLTSDLGSVITVGFIPDNKPHTLQLPGPDFEPLISLSSEPDIEPYISQSLGPDIKPFVSPSSGLDIEPFLSLPSGPDTERRNFLSSGQDVEPLISLSSGSEPANTPARSENEAEMRSGSNNVATEDGPDDNQNATVLKSVLSLIQDRPKLYDYSVALNLLAHSCGKDKNLWKMITNWLKDVQLPGEDQLRDSISLLVPATPDKVFRFMLTSVPSQDRFWSILLLERILFALRPLTLPELLDIDLLDRVDEPQHELPEVSAMRRATKRIFGWFLDVRRKEIRLAHPALRGFLLTSTERVVAGWPPLASAASIHGRIATACLNYLISPKRRQLMEQRTGPGSWHTPFECRNDFLSYAVKYWLRHATSAGKEIFKSDACNSFMADNDAVRLWVILYQGLSSPVAKRGMSSVSLLESLAIFAKHEAEDLLFSSIKNHLNLGTPELGLACFAALVEAAEHGNIRMVKELIALPFPEWGTLDQLILAAIEGGNKDAFVEIINLGQKNPERIQNFTPLLARAASLGRIDFVEILLDAMETSEISIGRYHNLSPLSFACQRGHVEVVKLLIREWRPAVVAELRGIPQLTSPSVRLAVQFGKMDILEILRSVVAKRLQDSAAIEFFRSVFTESSLFGRRRPVRDVLDYIESNLQFETRGPTADETDVPPKNDEENTAMSYLCREVVRIGSRARSTDAIQHAIDQWPHAIDVVDFLTKPTRSIMKDPQFPSYFETWIKAAVTSGNIAVVNLVFENGAKSSYATAQVLKRVATAGFIEALLKDFIFCMKYLIEKGADITSCLLPHGRTPLFHAVYENLDAAVKVLIEAKADVNAKGDNSWFPIHASYDSVDITQQLISAGADVDALTISSNNDNEGVNGVLPAPLLLRIR